jgi:hypothetical protein
MQNKGFQVATGLTGVFQLTKKLELFAEWDAFYPTGPISSFGPQHYAVGGLVYFITNNFAVDARAGVGLNSRSNALGRGRVYRPLLILNYEHSTRTCCAVS